MSVCHRASTCCEEWTEVAEAYLEGRHEEAIAEVLRRERERGAPSCHVGRMLVSEMRRRGDL